MKELILKLKEEEMKLITKLATLKNGTDEYANTLQDLANINGLLIKLDEHENNVLLDKEKFEEDVKHKKNELELEKVKFEEDVKHKNNELELEDKKYRFGISSNILNNTIAVLGIIMPLVCYSAWLRQGYKFEEEGVISSSTTKGLLGKIRPTK